MIKPARINSHPPVLEEERVSLLSRASIATLAFLAILRRDLLVTWREGWDFLIQALLQSVLFLFIFGKLLPLINLEPAGFVALLFPGIIALTVIFSASQSVTLPLVLDLGFGREIDDRLLAPLPIGLVCVEKVVFAAVRGLIAGSAIFPFAYLILGNQSQVRVDSLGLVAGVMLLTAFIGASMGIVIGTLVKPNRVGLMFTLIFVPLTFTGAAYYPWGALAPLRWFQVLTLFNPLTYASEGLRYAMIPTLRSSLFTRLGTGGIFLELGAIGVILFLLGLWTFQRRVVL